MIRSQLLLLACVAFPWISSAADPKPNVLFIAVDDLKPLLGCYGNKTIKTPNIDSLATRCVVFERAYANQAVCAPSRNSLLTGKRPQTLGIYDLGTNFRTAEPDAVTLPQAFKKAGYRTEALGKIFHVGHGNHEDDDSWTLPHWKENTVAYLLPESHSATELTREESFFSNAGNDVGRLPKGAAFEAPDVPDDEYPDGRIANEAILRLRTAKADKETPWFLAVGFLKPHLPFCAPKKYWDLYDPAKFELPKLQTPPEGAPKFAPTTFGEVRQYSDMPETGPLTEEQARKMIHGYHAAVSYMDAQLGKVIAALDKLGLAKNTIIVLWGDHGWHLGDHGQWSKHSNYEEAARIPLLVSAPGVKSNGKSAALVETVDIFPTVCELAAVAPPAGLEGRSFAATVLDPTVPTKESITHVFPRGEKLGRAIRTARYRMVEWKKPGAPADTAILELYDYEKDPEETKNLADSQPDVVAKLREILAKQPEAKPQISNQPKPSKKDRTDLFAKKDANKDEKLTHEEFMASQPDPEAAEKRFVSFDVDKNGELSQEEFVNMGAEARKE